MDDAISYLVGFFMLLITALLAVVGYFLNLKLSSLDESSSHNGKSLFDVKMQLALLDKSVKDLTTEIISLSTHFDRLQTDMLRVKNKADQLNPIKIEENFGRVLELEKKVSGHDKSHNFVMEFLKKKSKDGRS